MTRSVLLQARESLNQCMWYDVLCLLTLNYTFIDLPLTSIGGERFMAQTNVVMKLWLDLVIRDGGWKTSPGKPGERNSDSMEAVSIN